VCPSAALRGTLVSGDRTALRWCSSTVATPSVKSPRSRARSTSRCRSAPRSRPHTASTSPWRRQPPPEPRGSGSFFAVGLAGPKLLSWKLWSESRRREKANPEAPGRNKGLDGT
jgi:hypothetical protein